MQEFNLLQLLFDFFSGRAKTRVYTTFLGWFLVFHIDIIFIALFIDQGLIYEKTNMLKGEYVWTYISHFGLWSIAIESVRIAAAAIVTYLMIWVVPELINEKSYKQELNVEYKLRKMKIDKDEALNQREEVVVKQQLENIETEKQVAVERAKLDENPEFVRWDADFNLFEKSTVYNAFDEVVKTVYEYNGYPSNRVSSLRPSTTVIAYLDSNGIITIKEGQISFTDKGRYFVKKYTERTTTS